MLSYSGAAGKARPSARTSGAGLLLPSPFRQLHTLRLGFTCRSSSSSPAMVTQRPRERPLLGEHSPPAWWYSVRASCGSGQHCNFPVKGRKEGAGSRCLALRNVQSAQRKGLRAYCHGTHRHNDRSGTAPSLTAARGQGGWSSLPRGSPDRDRASLYVIFVNSASRHDQQMTLNLNHCGLRVFFL